MKEIQSKKYSALKKDSNHALGLGNDFIKCFELLDDYLKDYGSQQEKNDFTIFQNQYAEIKRNSLMGTWDTDTINRNRSKLNSALLEFIVGLKPQLQQSSDSDVYFLRKKTEWDSRGNLVTYIQLSENDGLIERLFKSLTTDKKWKALIRREMRYLNENGETGALVPEGLELDEDEEVEFSDCVINYAVRFERKNEEGITLAELLAEFHYSESQIWINANGFALEKCEMLNDLISWFDRKLGKNNFQNFSIGIPFPQEFKAELFDEQSELPSLVRLSMMQRLVE